MILVSACLLGYKTKYNGESNLQELLLKHIDNNLLLPICPECLGLLKIPHPPAEIVGGDGASVLSGNAQVINKLGCDVTANFLAGAEKVALLADKYEVKYAILKERSPSCGVNQIYDGSFSDKKIAGRGVCAEYLHRKDIKLFSEEELTNELLEQLLAE